MEKDETVNTISPQKIAQFRELITLKTKLIAEQLKKL